jgi:hypothetical protein
MRAFLNLVPTPVDALAAVVVSTPVTLKALPKTYHHERGAPLEVSPMCQTSILTHGYLHSAGSLTDKLVSESFPLGAVWVCVF